MVFVLTLYNSRVVTKTVSKLRGVITRYVSVEKVQADDGSVDYVSVLVTAVTMPVDNTGRRKAFVTDINQYYGIVKHVIA